MPLDELASFLVIRIDPGGIPIFDYADGFNLHLRKQKRVSWTFLFRTLFLSTKRIFYRALRTTISPVGSGLPSSGSTEIPNASNEPIGVSELTTSTPCPFVSTFRSPALTGASPSINQT